MLEQTVRRAVLEPVWLIAAGALLHAQDESSLDLYRHALTLPPALQRPALVDAASAGSLDAAARMIELAMWDDMGRIKMAADAVAAWRESTAKIDGMPAAQINAILCANHEISTKPQDWAKDVQQWRDWLSRSGVSNAYVAAALARLYEDFEPRDALKAHDLRRDLAKSFESLASKADPLLRGACFHAAAESLRPDRVTSGDWTAAAEMYGRAVQIRESVGDLDGSGASLFEQAWCVCPEHHPSGNWSQAADLFGRSARAREQTGDRAGCGDSLHWQGWCLEPDHNSEGDWSKAAGVFGLAAGFREKAGDFAGSGRSLFCQAFCFEPVNNPEGDWSQAAELLGRSAELREKGGDLAGAGKSLSEQAWCLKATALDAGDWSQATAVAARAAGLRDRGGDRVGSANSLFLQALCILRDGHDRSDAATARALLIRAKDILTSVPGSDELPRVNKWIKWIDEG